MLSTTASGANNPVPAEGQTQPTTVPVLTSSTPPVSGVDAGREMDEESSLPIEILNLQLLLRNAVLEDEVASLRRSQALQLCAAIKEVCCRVEGVHNLLLGGGAHRSVPGLDCGTVDAVKTVLAYNCDPNTTATDSGATPLLIAAQFGNVDVVKVLLEYSADPNKAATSKYGVTPLYLAAGYGNDELAKVLLEHNADPNKAATDNGDTPALIAAQFGHLDVLSVLLKHSADPNKATTDKYGATPLHIAAQYGDVDVMKLLLAHNADPNKARTADGATPLFMAVDNAHADIAALLLARNADPNKARTDIGATPMYLAAEKGQLDVVHALLANNADPNKARTDDGSTPAYIAVANGHSTVVKVLLQHNGNVHNARTHGGNGKWTPLNMAVQKGSTDTAHLLKQFGEYEHLKSTNVCCQRHTSRPANVPAKVRKSKPKLVRFTIPKTRSTRRVRFKEEAEAEEEEISTGEVDPDSTPVKQAPVLLAHAAEQATPELATSGVHIDARANTAPVIAASRAAAKQLIFGVN